MWFGGPNQALAGNPEAIQMGNDKIIALERKNPGILPVATVHPYDGEAALSEVSRVAAAGVKILKIHPHAQKFDAADSRILKLVRHAGDHDIIILIDNANILPADSEKLFNLALAAPNTKFILAHMGAMNFRFWNILKAVRESDNKSGHSIPIALCASIMAETQSSGRQTKSASECPAKMGRI